MVRSCCLTTACVTPSKRGGEAFCHGHLFRTTTLSVLYAMTAYSGTFEVQRCSVDPLPEVAPLPSVGHQSCTPGYSKVAADAIRLLQDEVKKLREEVSAKKTKNKQLSQELTGAKELITELKTALSAAIGETEAKMKELQDEKVRKLASIMGKQFIVSESSCTPFLRHVSMYTSYYRGQLPIRGV